MSAEDLDALFADAELPFGHPRQRFDDTPEGFDRSPLMDQGPERDYTSDEDGGVVHYGPGNAPLCGNDSMTAVYTDDPALVAGCADCLELVAEDHRPGRSRVAANGPPAMPALREGRMVKESQIAV